MCVARSEHGLLLAGDGDQDGTGMGVERNIAELFVLVTIRC